MPNTPSIEIDDIWDSPIPEPKKPRRPVLDDAALREVEAAAGLKVEPGLTSKAKPPAKSKASSKPKPALKPKPSRPKRRRRAAPPTVSVSWRIEKDVAEQLNEYADTHGNMTGWELFRHILACVERCEALDNKHGKGV